MKRALLMVLCGCGVQFTPETVVNSLRVMAVTAEPPEVAPGQQTALSILWGDPQRSASDVSFIWVGCEPDPLDLGRSACNDASILIKPSLITNYPPGLKLLGFSNVASYASAPDVFSVLPPEDVIRKNGSVGQVLAIVVAEKISVTATGPELEAIFKRIETKETPTAIAITRIVVSEKEQKNHNPVIEGLTFDGAPLAQNSRLQVRAGQQVALGVSVSADSRESYVEYQPSGEVTKTETVVGAWYSSAGRFSQERFDVTSTVGTTFTAPGSAEFPEDPVPERRAQQLWLVVRDNRGAQAFQQFRFYVCDESLPSPTVASLSVPASATDPVIVKGANMDRALDVIIGGKALINGTYSSVQQGFTGFLPDLAPGTYPVEVHGQNCSSADTGLTYTVQ